MEELFNFISLSEEDDYLLSGVELLKEKKIEKAIEFFDIAIEKNKRYKEAYFNKGLAMILLKEFDKAKEMFKTCIIIDKAFGKAYMFLGDLAYFVEGKTEIALENYNKAIINNFDEESVHLSKAFIYSSIKDYISSIKSYNKALLINPKSKKALLGKLEIYFSQKKFREAQECVNKLREIATESEEYYTWASIINIAQGNEKEALEILKEADLVIGFSEKLAFSRIKVYERMEKIEECINYIEKIEDKLLEDDNIYYKFINQKVSYLLKLDRKDEAISILNKLTEEYDSCEADFKLGNLLLTENKFKEALVLFDKILDRNLEENDYFSTAIYMKAICKDKLGEKEESKALFTEALLFIKSLCLLNPLNIELLSMQALCLYQVDKLEDAEKCVIKGLKLAPKDINLLIVGAKIANKNGKTNIAKERVKAIIEINPSLKNNLDEELNDILIGE